MQTATCGRCARQLNFLASLKNLSSRFSSFLSWHPKMFTCSSFLPPAPLPWSLCPLPDAAHLVPSCRTSASHPSTTAPTSIPSSPRLNPPFLNLSSNHAPTATFLSTLRHFYTHSNALPHSGACAHTLGRQAAEHVGEARQCIARHLNLDHENGIIFAPSLFTAGFTLVDSIAKRMKKREEVILTGLESDWMILAWEKAARRYGIRVKHVKVGEDGAVQFGAVAGLVSSRTRLVVMKGGCGVYGRELDMGEVVEFMGNVEVPVMVDGCEALEFGGAVDMRGVSILLGGGIGVFGGGGVIWGGSMVWEKFGMEEIEEGMGMGGVGIAGGVAGVMKAQGIGERFGRRLREAVGGIQDVEIVGGGHAGEGNGDWGLLNCVCFRVKGVGVAEVGMAFERKGVVVDVGMHGSGRVHRDVLGWEGGSVRVVVDCVAEIERLREVLSEVVEEVSGR